MTTSLRTLAPLRAFLSLLAVHTFTTLTGCQPADLDVALDADGALDEENVGEGELALSNAKKEGRRLFEEETFGGNGRTCATCHGAETGTVSPAEAKARFLANPNDPLFAHDGSDDGNGNGAQKMQDHATVLVRIPLPPGVRLATDHSATSVVLRRGIPSTLNTPALDPVLMYDGRAPDLKAQAEDAILGHAQATIAPTNQQLKRIAKHQKTRDFFSSDELYDYAHDEDADPPSLPLGTTAAEKRGRKWFEDAPIAPAVSSASPRKGLCAMCHSGPMLNTANGYNPLPIAPFPKGPDPFSPEHPCDVPATQADHVPAGTRFQSVLVSELNTMGNPWLFFEIKQPNSDTWVPVQGLPVADPGNALISGNFDAFPVKGGRFGTFKIPTLWGVKRTAPYFHDNSAKTLEELIEHYATFFALGTGCGFDGDPPLVMTVGDKKDLLAYLKLL